MAAAAIEPTAALPDQRVRGFTQRWYRTPSFVAGLLILGTLIGLALAAPLVTRYSPTAQDLHNTLQGSSSEHWLGTDQLGRDVWSRLVYAGRTDLKVGFLAVFLPFLIGTTLGSLAGYYGGKLDTLVAYLVNVVVAFPFYVLIIAILFALGPGERSIYIAITFVGWVSYTRIIRAEIMVAKRREYVEAARVAGLRDSRIIIRHLLPNVIMQAVIFAMSDIVLSLAAIVTLGYIGLGIQPPTPDWGDMIAGGQNFITTKWQLCAFPGLCVVLTGLGLSLLADGINDLMRPECSEPAGPLLDVRDLHVRIPLSRGTVRAVDGASFTVERGQALGLVGESGCGKSMTLRAILGLLPRPARITAGAVLFEGEDLAAASASRLRDLRGKGIAMIFQEPMTALNPVMRVGAQIAEAPYAHLGYGRRKARERALELMQLVGIPDPVRRAESYPHELSGGMRQRVMIAIALSCEPRLILCDEPTTALDVTIQDQILKLLLRLREELGMSIVFVTHDLAVVAQTCQTLAVMYAGQVVETGTVHDVFHQPRHPYTLGLLRSVPDPDDVRETLDSIPGSPPDLVAPPDGCRFAARCVFAEDDCVEGDKPLLPLEGGRASACIHPDRPAAAVREQPVITGV